MSTVDVYRITDRLDEATLEALVDRLEARGKHPRFIEMMQQYLDAMDIDSATNVLDLVDEMIVDAQVTNARIMREMPRLLREVGLERTTAFAHVVADIGAADFFAPALQALTRLLPKSGAMSESDARAWADAMLKRSEEGTYFGASNFYSYVATRP